MDACEDGHPVFGLARHAQLLAQPAARWMVICAGQERQLPAGGECKMVQLFIALANKAKLLQGSCTCKAVCAAKIGTTAPVMKPEEMEE